MLRSYSRRHVDVDVEGEEGGVWRLRGFMESPMLTEKKKHGAPSDY